MIKESVDWLKYTEETCPHCDAIVVIPNDRMGKCSKCGIYIRPCSACPTNDRDYFSSCDWEEEEGCSIYKNIKEVRHGV